MNRARETGLPIVRLRREATFEALLSRLTVAAPDRWLLKGGLALDLRLSARARTTKDMDLARSDSEEAATRDFAEAQSLDIGDHFAFTITRSQNAGGRGSRALRPLRRARRDGSHALRECRRRRWLRRHAARRPRRDLNTGDTGICRRPTRSCPHASDYAAHGRKVACLHA